jgi:Fic family protein
MESAERQEVAYNQNTPLEGIFRNSIARILDFFILNQDFDYSPAELTRITGVPLRTVQRAITHLSEKNLIKENRPVGNTTMYILNLNSPLAVALRDYVKTAVNQHANELIRKASK